MSDILEQLFYGEYNVVNMGPSAEYKALMEQSVPLWNKVYDTVGKEGGERLWENQCAMALTESVEAFREGVSLGMRLMLDLFYGKP